MTDATPLSSVSFRLLIAGATADALLTERLAAWELKPKHVALLSALRLGAPGSQSELAALLNIAPSLVVVFADHLESLGAVTRERDPLDRRRQQLVLTAEGERLLQVSNQICDEIDAILQQDLPPAERASVAGFLAAVVKTANVPVDESTAPSAR